MIKTYEKQNNLNIKMSSLLLQWYHIHSHNTKSFSFNRYEPILYLKKNFFYPFFLVQSNLLFN
jgi:hypothetical protein